MPIKNYTATVPANCSISEIQGGPVKYGSTCFPYKYEQRTGRIEALQWLLRRKSHDVAFSLPVYWRRYQRVLELQQVRRWDEEEYVYRVAWPPYARLGHGAACLYETALVDMAQVFLTFAADAKGQTLYEKMVEGKFLLGPEQRTIKHADQAYAASPDPVLRMHLQKHMCQLSGSPAQEHSLTGSGTRSLPASRYAKTFGFTLFTTMNTL